MGNLRSLQQKGDEVGHRLGRDGGILVGDEQVTPCRSNLIGRNFFGFHRIEQGVETLLG